MEFPDLGRQCSIESCNQLDFLPMKCDACTNIFCKDHIQYSKHNCQEGLKRDVQVPVCPLCNKPVPTRRGEPPDIMVGEHIDRDCQSDPAQTKRNKLYTKKCGLKGCKEKDMLSVSCPQCHQAFCLRHRHSQDHNCQDVQASGKLISKPGAAAMSRLQQNHTHSHSSSSGNMTRSMTKGVPSYSIHKAPVVTQSANPVPKVNGTMVSAIQGQLSEDEALAMALQNSLLEEQSPQHEQWTDRGHLSQAMLRQSRRNSTNCNVS